MDGKQNVDYRKLFDELTEFMGQFGVRKDSRIFTLGNDTLVNDERASIYTGLWSVVPGMNTYVVAVYYWTVNVVNFVQGTEEDFLHRMKYLHLLKDAA